MKKQSWQRIKSGVLLFGVFFLLTLTGCLEFLEEAKPLEKGMLKVGMNLEIPTLCYLSEEESIPQGFEVEIAQKLAERLELSLEIVNTSKENLLKSLDGNIYDCTISGVGIAEWNQNHYSSTDPYADLSSVQEEIGVEMEYTQIAVFTRKKNPMTEVLNEELQNLKDDGTLQEISQKYFKKDIIIK